jgi:hypothetical protein
MKSLMIAFISSCLAVACTSKETEIKEAGLAAAKQELAQEMKAEIAKGVSSKVHLQATAARILTEKAIFEVQSSQDQGEEANVVVEAKTEPEKVKDALIDIMSKLEDQKENRFNVSDALHLIHQKMNLPEDAYSTRSYKIKLRHSSSGGDAWQPVREAKK